MSTRTLTSYYVANGECEIAHVQITYPDEKVDVWEWHCEVCGDWETGFRDNTEAESVARQHQCEEMED